MTSRRGRTGKRRRRNLDAYNVEVWEERDRLSVVLNDEHGETVAEWWDDDARQMFEDGFFDARRLRESVIEYARDMGLV